MSDIESNQLENGVSQNEKAYSHGAEQSEIGLFEYLKIIKSNKWLILLITFVITTASIVIAFLSVPIYRAEALLAPVTRSDTGSLTSMVGQFGGLASLAGVNLGNADNDTAQAIATLKSREFTYEFIKEKNLLPILFAERWDDEKKEWKSDSKVPTLWLAYNLFNGSIRQVSVNNKNGFVTLAVEWKNPEQAVDWVMEMIQRINNQLRHKAIVEAEQSIKYLENEIQKTGVIEVRQSVYKLIEAQTKNKMIANTQEDYVFRVIDRAVVPEERIRPKRKSLIVMGFVIGLMLGLIIVFIKHQLNRSR